MTALPGTLGFGVIANNRNPFCRRPDSSFAAMVKAVPHTGDGLKFGAWNVF